MATSTKTVSLLDFNNAGGGVTYLWFAGVGAPAGRDYNHDTDSDGEDYCNLTEVIDQLDIWELTGTVTGKTWEWDGQGSPRDERGNSILKITAR